MLHLRLLCLVYRPFVIRLRLFALFMFFATWQLTQNISKQELNCNTVQIWFKFFQPVANDISGQRHRGLCMYINYQIHVCLAIFIHLSSLCLLLNKLHLSSLTDHRFIVTHIFTLTRLPSGTKGPLTFFYYKGPILFVRFCNLNSWGCPKYRPKLVAYM